MIALFSKAVRSALREIGGRGEAQAPRSFVDTKPRHPAQSLLHAEVSWARAPRKGLWYATEVEGVAWSLHVDVSHQGTRYIVDHGGQTVAEFDAAPLNWRFDPGFPGEPSA